MWCLTLTWYLTTTTFLKRQDHGLRIGRKLVLGSQKNLKILQLFVAFHTRETKYQTSKPKVHTQVYSKWK